MLPEIEKIKGIHPGHILKRELRKRHIKSSELACNIDEHKQTISAIINQKRKITPRLSIKLSKMFDVPNDYFLHLQASYDVKNMTSSLAKQERPNLTKFRQVLFWDTDIKTIDWNLQKRAIIKRVLERGNDTEIEALINFYGRETISYAIKKISNIRLKRYDDNLIRFNLK